MNIAVNTRLLINDLHGGTEWFAYETLKRITLNHKEHKFFFLFDRHYDDKFIFSDNITPIVLRPRAIHPFLWHFWLECRVSPTLKKVSADIFLSPDGMIPLNTGVNCLPVIHDINFFHRRKDLPPFKSAYFRIRYRKFAERASRIATVSEYSKKDIADTWGIEPGKIDVIYNGVSEIFCLPTGRNGDKSQPPYFLFVGNLSPRKNVPNLIRAFNKFRDVTTKNHKLIIAGSRFFLNGEMDRLINQSKYKADIIMAGIKSPVELRDLYQKAEAMVFIPWFEGFGIPILEAMRCGTPVIASDSTSIPEVAGNAALLVDPSNVEEISEAMINVSGNNNLKKRMSADGTDQASKFNWDKTAENLWASIMKSIKSK